MELPDVRVLYQPILDVARGIVAGYQAVTMPIENVPSGLLHHSSTQRHIVATTLRSSLAAFPDLPTNTFLSIPIPLALAEDPLIQRILAEHGDLAGVVLDITDFDGSPASTTETALEAYRTNGALIGVSGRHGKQPELGAIVKLRPAIIRLGAPWTRDLDQHPTRRSEIEVTGRLAGQLDAWILADDVQTSAELRALAELEVPLARGPLIGNPQTRWSTIPSRVRRALPRVRVDGRGGLRPLLQQAYTTRHLDAAQSVLPEASGYEYVVVVDEDSRPVSLLTQGILGRWDPIKVLTVNVETSVADTVTRALARPRATRFSPVACTDAAGRFVGILRIERLVEHLAAETARG